MRHFILNLLVGGWTDETISNNLLKIILVVHLILSLPLWARLIFRRLHGKMVYELWIRGNLWDLLIYWRVCAATSWVAFLVQLVHPSSRQTTQLLKLRLEGRFCIGVVSPSQLGVAAPAHLPDIPWVWTNRTYLCCVLSLHALLVTVTFRRLCTKLNRYLEFEVSDLIRLNFFLEQIRYTA